MTVEDIVAYSDKQWGWTEGVINSWRTYETDELTALASGALEAIRPHGLAVEIGTFGGLSTSVILQVAKERDATVLACDPFGWVPDLARPKFFEQWNSFPEVNKLFVEGKSVDLHVRVCTVMKDPIDFIHVDGDHSCEAVELDCQLWLPHLRSGGIAAFHDAHPPQSASDAGRGVNESVEKYTKNWPVLHWIGRNWCKVVRKP